MSTTTEKKSAPPAAVFERCEDITKSQQDKRLYRGVKLKNNLRAFLISDPTTDKSAASLCVGVGESTKNIIITFRDAQP